MAHEIDGALLSACSPRRCELCTGPGRQQVFRGFPRDWKERKIQGGEELLDMNVLEKKLLRFDGGLGAKEIGAGQKRVTEGESRIFGVEERSD